MLSTNLECTRPIRFFIVSLTYNNHGYNFVHNHRPNRPGGGVGMYIDADLEFKFRDDNWIQFPSSPF